jgi:predicted nucleotidyltransferase
MRLSAAQQQCILQATRQNFGDDAKVCRVGSRVDDTRRGGDVDLYVETTYSNNLMVELKCKIALEESLDLHVDLVVNDPEKDKPIYKIAKKQGVQL